MKWRNEEKWNKWKILMKKKWRKELNIIMWSNENYYHIMMNN